MSGKSRILVVDDEPRGVELLVRTLRSVGEVETALSGEEAWQRAQQATVDVVISDQRMPGMSGVELLSKIAEHDENTGRILLTGYADLEATTDSINMGRVHAYLTKPCSPKDVQIAVRSVLERVELARENVRLVTDLFDKNRELTQTLRLLGEAQQRVVHSERLAAIGRMIAMIVHDLRTPISLIRSSGSEIIGTAHQIENAPIQALGQEVLDEAGHMQRICEELLDVTRASEDNCELQPASLDDVVASAMAHITEVASRNGVEVDLALASHSELPLNEDRLRRALRNLANNAIEAMPEGGLLRVETRSEGDVACLTVTDNGPGIPDLIMDRVFEPFVTHGKHGGSGLGLAIVRKVIEDHGGSVEASKPEGGGTRFEIRLPHVPAAPVTDPGSSTNR